MTARKSACESDRNSARVNATGSTSAALVGEDITDPEIATFRARVWEYGRELYRDLPWRNTRDPYEILVSEVMLQQTQVARVLTKWPAWLELFPTVDALAAAPLLAVLQEWQGLGYNRRAIALKKCAEKCAASYGGALPRTREELIALPGIGPATAAGVLAFAYGECGVYLETNVRTVFIHEFFTDAESDPEVGAKGITDKQLIPLIEATCDPADPRGWYYALLDYGAHLKKTMPNPSRRSAHHATQSKFEGSRRQKRAFLLREVMALPGESTDSLSASLSCAEEKAGRGGMSIEDTRSILRDLARDGFILEDPVDTWVVPLSST